MVYGTVIPTGEIYLDKFENPLNLFTEEMIYVTFYLFKIKLDPINWNN